MSNQNYRRNTENRSSSNIRNTRNAPRQTAGRSPQKDTSRYTRIADVLIILVLTTIGVLIVAAASRSAAQSIPPGAVISDTLDSIVISEIMTSNKSAIADENGLFPDYIEVYNPTSKTVNLAGIGLTDNLEVGPKFLFPVISLNPGAYLLVFASGKEQTTGELHANFKISSAGESISLLDTNGTILQTVDVPVISSDHAYALDLTQIDALEFHVTEQYTPGYPNTEEGWAAYSATRRIENSPIVISEVMTKNRITLQDEDYIYSDWVEIWNRGDSVINIGGFGLSNSASRLHRWKFPAIDMQPGERLIVFCGDKNSANPVLPLHAPFSLSSMKETVVLSNNLAQILDLVEVPTLEKDQSYSRQGDSDAWQITFQPTPGFPNDSEGYRRYREKHAAQNTTGIVISEVINNNVSAFPYEEGVYYPAIELHNKNTYPVSLEGWGITDDSGKLGRYELTDIVLQPDEYFVLYASGLNTSEYDDDAKKKYHTNFKLSAEGATIVLTDIDDAVIDSCTIPRTPINYSYGRNEGSVFFSYMAQPTFGAANEAGLETRAPTPVITHSTGNYSDSVDVSIITQEGYTIYYTTDGSDPNRSSTLYSGAIRIGATTPLRAIAVKDGCLDSIIATSMIFINAPTDVAIVSAVIDPIHLYDPVTGLFEKGPNASPEWPYLGANWYYNTEVPCTLSVIETNGTLGIQQECAFRVFGSYSRQQKGKSFAIIARYYYGPGKFNYRFFEERTFSRYDSFIVRNGASEWNASKIRDIFTSSLARDTTDMETQMYRPCTLYINGEFWGVYFIMEKVTDHYIASIYNIDEESIDMLVGNGNKKAYIHCGSNTDWLELMAYVKEYGLTETEHYEYIKTKVDVENYADYLIIETFCNNSDTGNVKFWRSSQLDNRWRWILYDTDWGYGAGNATAAERDYVEEYFNEKGHGTGNMFDTTLPCALMKNAEWRALFLERVAYHLRETFDITHSLERIDEIAAPIAEVMKLDRARWDISYDRWLNQLDVIRSYVRSKPDYYVQQVKKTFNVTDEEAAKYFGT
ncbi:MAG: lamin tail domain-containing protein [Christensenellales bacterium]